MFLHQPSSRFSRLDGMVRLSREESEKDFLDILRISESFGNLIEHIGLFLNDFSIMLTIIYSRD